jgi:hypothetical protein
MPGILTRTMAGRSRDWLGTLLGLLVFAGGVMLLLVCFSLAYGLFQTPPERVLGIEDTKSIDLPSAGSSLVGVLIRILLLVVMAVVGSLLANRGIAMYAAARAQQAEAQRTPEA